MKTILKVICLLTVMTMFMGTVSTASDTTKTLQTLVLRSESIAIPITFEPAGERMSGFIEPGTIFQKISVDGDYWLICLADGSAGWIKAPDHPEIFDDITDADFVNEIFDPAIFNDSTNIRSTTPESARLDVSPVKIVVSLAGLTCHVVCPDENIDWVFPVGVGVKGSSGRSITPTCASRGVDFFRLHSNPKNTWYYMAKRKSPAYFGGFPFLRMNIENSKKAHTYGLHGPITKNSKGWYLQRGYVSHGCIRMQGEDVKKIYNLAIRYPGARVLIQQAVETRSDGTAIDVDFKRWN